jgi:hypothetical protein
MCSLSVRSAASAEAEKKVASSGALRPNCRLSRSASEARGALRSGAQPDAFHAVRAGGGGCGRAVSCASLSLARERCALDGSSARSCHAHGGEGPRPLLGVSAECRRSRGVSLLFRQVPVALPLSYGREPGGNRNPRRTGSMRMFSARAAGALSGHTRQTCFDDAKRVEAGASVPIVPSRVRSLAANFDGISDCQTHAERRARHVSEARESASDGNR